MVNASDLPTAALLLIFGRKIDLLSTKPYTITQAKNKKESILWKSFFKQSKTVTQVALIYLWPCNNEYFRNGDLDHVIIDQLGY